MFWFVFVFNFNVRILVYISAFFLMWPEDIIFFPGGHFQVVSLQEPRKSQAWDPCEFWDNAVPCWWSIYAFAIVGLLHYVGAKPYILSAFSFPYSTIVLAFQFETNNSRHKSKSKLTMISIKYFVCIFVKDKGLIRLYWMLFILLLLVTVACHRCHGETLLIHSLCWTLECHIE